MRETFEVGVVQGVTCVFVVLGAAALEVSGLVVLFGVVG